LTDAELAAQIATEAGDLLLAIQKSGLSGRQMGDAGDLQANLHILARLRAERPGESILSEESADDPTRLTQSRVWIVDPLDGTREFGEGRDDWAVHVALAVDGVPAAGAVALPGLGVTLVTRPAPVVPARPDGTPARVVVSRSRPPIQAIAVNDALGGVLVPMGSAGAKAMAVVRGEVDVYVHGGGQYEWDNCAPAAVALAAGLHVSRFDGSPLRYNNADPYLPDLVVCRPELAGRVLDAVATALP
jgi:3'(2'), 5'-bisphosphate nucleotidase